MRDNALTILIILLVINSVILQYQITLLKEMLSTLLARIKELDPDLH